MKKIKESKNLRAEEKKLLFRCSDAIRKISPSAEVILYGSRAKGNAGPDSDYDLLVLIDEHVTLEKEDDIRQQLFQIELETETVITVNVYNSKDWNSQLYRAMPFHQNVVRDGLML